MKSKFFRILGVVTTVAVLASMLSIASVTAVSTPTIILTGQGAGVAYTISNTNIYTTTFTAGAAVAAGGKINVVFPATTNLANLIAGNPSVVSTGGAYSLPEVGQSFTITAVTAADTASLTITTGTVNVVVAGGAAYVAPNITFNAIGATATVTATAASTGSWARTAGTATAAATAFASSNVTVTALAGIGGGSIATTNAVYSVSGTYPAAQTLSIVVPAGGIGSGSLVQLIIGTLSGVINPSAAGSYTFTVATTTAVPVTIEAAATSAAYTIINPVLVTPPGVVSVYNPAGVLMTQTVGAGTLKLAVEAITVEGYSITLGPGVYQEAVDITIAAAAKGLTVKATGAVADTVVPANWTVNASNVTFKGLTMETRTAGTAGTAVTVGAAADNVTFDGCTFVRSGDATSTGAQTFIDYQNATATTGKGTITGCTFDGTLASVNETLVKAAATSVGLTVTKSTFKLDLNGTTYASDYGIDAAATLTISENTFTGTVNFGKAIKVTGGTATINKNTFTGVKEAVETTGGTVKFTNNTVDASGYVLGTTGLTDYPFKITATAGFTAYQNKITNSKYYIALVSANDNLVHFNFNEFSGNNLGINNAAAGVMLDATHNWWGAASGPVADYNTVSVDATEYLGGIPSNGVMALGVNTLDAKTTTGIIVQLLELGVLGAMDATDQIGIATYAANPAAAAPSSSLKVGKYFDVFVVDVGGDDVDTARILFYGTVNAFSEIWVYSPFAGTWVKCSDQSVNATSGFVAVDITAVTTPSLIDLFSTPFVLVEAPPAAPGSTPAVQSPALGATNVAIDTTFTWPAVAGAVSYEFEIAEEIGQSDKFYLKDEVGSSTVSAFKLVDTLKYDTQYWWRVRAVNSLGVKSAYTTSFFTTAKEPVVVEPLPPVVIEQTPPPQITLEIPPAQVTKVEPIPAYLLWAVIAVGAILVIAVIVLIVRTRRIS